MVHINELTDYTVETFVVCRNRVLLRFHDKYGIWLSVGGHVELNENPNQAAIREVREEVGLDVVLYDRLRPFIEKNEKYEELIPPYFMNIHKISETHRHVAMTFFAKSETDQLEESETEKSSGCRWMTKDEIEKDPSIKGSIKIYAIKALEELGM